MAVAVLAYLLKANVALALSAAAYYGLLRRLTFFSLNRAYLIGTLLLATVYPALPVPALLSAAPAIQLPALTALPAGPTATGAAPAPEFDWPAAGLAVYGLGTVALLLRLLGQVLSLWLLRRRSRPAAVLGQPVRVLPGAGGPFSFGRTIYLSEASLANAADLPAVLHHEQAHMRQHHTLDVLLAQLTTMLAWPNPAAWLLRRALLDNLEYLADRAALRTGLDRRAYQYSLLCQQLGGVPAPALAFHLSSFTLKNRITMLNQPVSTLRHLGRYALAASLVGALAVNYAGTWAATPPAAGSRSLPAASLVYLDGKPATRQMISALESQETTHIEALLGIQARIFAPGMNSVEAFFTKTGGQTRAARELAARLDKIDASVPLIEVAALPAAARDYAARHYPDYKIGLAYRIDPAARQAAVYQVILAKNKRPGDFLLFDKAGNFTQVIPGP